MTAKRRSKASAKGEGLRSLRARGVSAKKAKSVKAGEINHSEFRVVKLMDVSTPK